MCKKSLYSKIPSPDKRLWKITGEVCSEGESIFNKFSIINHLLMFPKLHWTRNHWEVLVKNMYSEASSTDPLKIRISKKGVGIDELFNKVLDDSYCQRNLKDTEGQRGWPRVYIRLTTSLRHFSSPKTWICWYLLKILVPLTPQAFWFKWYGVQPRNWDFLKLYILL